MSDTPRGGVTPQAQGRQPVDAGGDGEVVSEQNAKQGRRGLHVFWMLAISLVLVVVALFAVWGFHAPRLASAAGAAQTSRSEAPASHQFNAAEPAPKMNPGPESAPAPR